MENNTTTPQKKGRFWWIIGVLEILIVVAYLVIAGGGIFKSGMDYDFEGMVGALKAAILFLIIATVAVTVMCFLPPFKSKGNMVVAVCNIIWLIWIISTII